MSGMIMIKLFKFYKKLFNLYYYIMNKLPNSNNPKEEKSHHKITGNCLTKCSDWKLYTTIFVNKDSFSLV